MLDEKTNALADLAQNGRMENIFATPIFSHVFKGMEALNRELREVILEKERTAPSVSKSNLGGWQSPPDFFGWGGGTVAALERHVRFALNVATVRATAPQCLKASFDLFGWAAVNRNGHCNAPHLHPGATWSGVYYVDPGDEEAGGQLEFAHPVAAAAMTFFPGALPSARLIKPEPGLIVLFPSYLIHSVRMYRGERPRVCVPFNAHMTSAVARNQVA